MNPAHLSGSDLLFKMASRSYDSVISHARVWLLTVGIQEGESVACRHGGSKEPGGYQALSLPLADHSNNVQLFQILVQFVLKSLCEKQKCQNNVCLCSLQEQSIIVIFSLCKILLSQRRESQNALQQAQYKMHPDGR